MFDFIRNHKRWMQFILLILILPAFMLFGLESYTNLTSDEKLASWSGGELTKTEFETYYKNFLENQAMQNPDAPQQDSPVLRQQILDLLIQQKLADQFAKDNYLSASDARLQKQILTNPYFADENGQFSIDKYKEILQQFNTSVSDFESSERYSLAWQDVFSSANDAIVHSPDILKKLALFQWRNYDIQYKPLNMQDFMSQVKITDADLEQFFQNETNAQKFKRPTNVNLDYFTLDIETIFKQLPELDPAEIEKEFNSQLRLAEKDLGRQVSFIQIDASALKTPEEIQNKKSELLTEVQNMRAQPEKFNEFLLSVAVSKENAEANSLIWITKDQQGIDKQLIEWLFQPNVTVGSISDPIQVDGSSFYILKMVDERIIDKDAIRANVVANLKNKQASDTFRKLNEEITQLASNKGNKNSFQEVVQLAQKVGGKVQSLSNLTEQGVAEGMFAKPEILDQVFKQLNVNEVPNLLTLMVTNDQLLVVNVTAIVPSYVPKLADIRKEVEMVYRAQIAHENILEKASELVATLNEGKAVEGMQSERLNSSIITNPSAPIEVKQRIAPVLAGLAKVASSKLPHALIIPVGANGDTLVVQVKAIHMPELPDNMDEQIQQQIESQKTAFNNAAQQVFAKAMQKIYNVSITDIGTKVITEGL